MGCGPVVGDGGVEVFGDQADAIVCFDSFGLGFERGLGDSTFEVEFFSFLFIMFGFCPDLVDGFAGEGVDWCGSFTCDVDCPPSAVAGGVAEESFGGVGGADDDSLAGWDSTVRP